MTQDARPPLLLDALDPEDGDFRRKSRTGAVRARTSASKAWQTSGQVATTFVRDAMS
ncbi:hypothetical protein [Streptomyces sp. NPDC048603]|uniref:hypothetical protein n=1 Tax=Streptomyces sp. NPDC048603 TaxID=3365577 RepID=UPI003719BC3B